MCRKYRAISKSWKQGTDLTRFHLLPGHGHSRAGRMAQKYG